MIQDLIVDTEDCPWRKQTWRRYPGKNEASQAASRYKKRLEGGGGAAFGQVYLVRWGSTLVWHGWQCLIILYINIWLKRPVGTKKRLAATLRGGFTLACINDTEIPPPYVFTPRD